MKALQSLPEARTTNNPYFQATTDPKGEVRNNPADSQGVTLTVDGIAVRYRETGSGAPVVLLHGGGSSGAQWRRVCEILKDRYRMITANQFGHGGTEPWPGPPERLSHEAEATLVRAVISKVGGSVHLVGHSYGGGVALRLASRARSRAE